MGGEGDTADYAVTYLRIAALGLPFAFLALGGQGYLRGVADLRTPLLIVIAGNVANVILEVLFVYGFDWGIEGSAWGTVVAQAGMGAAFIVVHPARRARRHAAVMAADAAAARDRAAHLRPHGGADGRVHPRGRGRGALRRRVARRAPDRVPALGLPRARARRGRDRRPGARRARPRRRRRRARVCGEHADDLALGLRGRPLRRRACCCSQGVLPHVFTSDEAVVDRAQAIWWLFALMQPLNGAVFALDGILIGASDGRYLMWSMVAAFVASGVGRARRARVRLGDRRRLGRRSSS